MHLEGEPVEDGHLTETASENGLEEPAPECAHLNLPPPSGLPIKLSDVAGPSAALTWDCDMLKVPIEPSCLAVLSHQWTLANKGPNSKQAPEGMCICSWPYWVILVVEGKPSSSPSAANALLRMGEFLHEWIRDLSCTNNPIIRGHAPGYKKPWSSLSSGACTVGATALVDALLWLHASMPAPSFEIWLFSYGMKLPCRDLFPKLDAMWANVDPVAVGHYLSHATVDVATEVGSKGHVLLAKPAPWLRSTHHNWPGSSVTQYCLLAGLGQQYGGMTYKAGHDSDSLVHVVIYPGAWTHALYRLHRPALTASNNVDQGFYHKAGRKLKSSAQILRSWDVPLGGARVEVRCKLTQQWEQLQPILIAVVDDILPFVDVMEVSRADIINQATQAHTDATAAGLFLCRGGARAKAPAWKRQLYYRLLASIGYGQKFWNRMAYNMAASPWAVHPEAGGGNGMPVCEGLAAEGDAISLSSPHLQPHILGELSVDALDVNEAHILERLPDKRVRGGGWVVYYRPPWGGHGPLPKSIGYMSKPALARALWLWAGANWEHRVKL